MDSYDDDLFQPCTKEEDEKLDNNNVEHLLEKSWFYGKVLGRKPPGMFRCYSDPSPNFSHRILSDSRSITTSTCASKNVAVAAAAAAPNLIRTPSLPPCIGRKEEKDSGTTSKLNSQLSDLSLVHKEHACHVPNVSSKGSSFPRQKTKQSKHKLLRTPSLPNPSCIVAEQGGDDEEDDITMSRLIRDALLPPRSLSSKGMTQSYSIQKNRSAKNLKELRYPNQKNLKKSPSAVELESQEAKGFKDLGLPINQRNVNPELDKVKRVHLSGAWVAKTCATPPIPIWQNKNSAEDMKLQIKYWARAVASKAR